ncbi:MAG: hypothetical protein QOH46_3984, partial [Solirubrobacteraceae bacterium]|nr:hypothetical protein [Solirubrobacteraceae bacterium]
MSVDYTVEASIDAFAAEVERALDGDGERGELWTLIGTWTLAGVIFSLGAALDAGVLYLVGLVVVAFWVTGVMRGRGPA